MKTHNIPFSIKKKKITLSYPKSGTMRFFQGTQARVRSSRGKRAISVRANEVLLYFEMSVFEISTVECIKSWRWELWIRFLVPPGEYCKTTFFAAIYFRFYVFGDIFEAIYFPFYVFGDIFAAIYFRFYVLGDIFAAIYFRRFKNGKNNFCYFIMLWSIKRSSPFT